MFTKISQLYDLACSQKRKKRLVLSVAHDLSALEAVCEASKQNVIEPVFVGKKKEIIELASRTCFDLDKAEVINEPDDQKAVEKSVRLVHDGKADILMKGYVGTTVLMKAVLNRDYGLRSKNIISHFALFEADEYHKLFGLTDVAMNIAPNLTEKIGILENAVECLNTIGISNPKVAILGAVEMVHQNMQATLDAALISKMAQRGQIKNCMVDGPLAFDNVVSSESAHHKGIKSEVAGDTDLLLLPNIETGNVLYKALVWFGKAKLAGIILGAAAPVVLTSRSDSEESKLNSIILAAISTKND
jgi:phosphate butyryltransferase